MLFVEATRRILGVHISRIFSSKPDFFWKKTAWITNKLTSLFVLASRIATFCSPSFSPGTPQQCPVKFCTKSWTSCWVIHIGRAKTTGSLRSNYSPRIGFRLKWAQHILIVVTDTRLSPKHLIPSLRPYIIDHCSKYYYRCSLIKHWIIQNREIFCL